MMARVSESFSRSAESSRPIDLGLAGVALGEERPQRAVDHARGEDLLLVRPALALEEAAGDLAAGVGVLAVVDGQGQEVDARPAAPSARRPWPGPRCRRGARGRRRRPAWPSAPSRSTGCGGRGPFPLFPFLSALRSPPAPPSRRAGNWRSGLWADGRWRNGRRRPGPRCAVSGLLADAQLVDQDAVARRGPCPSGTRAAAGAGRRAAAARGASGGPWGGS